MAEKMVDMKRTKSERKADEGGHKIGEEDYPYGLSISLDHHGLKKLGMHEGKLPKVGSKIMLHAHAHVKSTHESSHDGGKPNRRMELELRHMSVEPGKGEMGGSGDTEEKMNKGMKHAVDKAVVGPKEEGSEEEGDAENE